MPDTSSDVMKEARNAAGKARTRVEGVLSGVQERGMDAVEGAREVGDNFVDAIDESLKKRPYTTLALAVGVGFLLGATWRH
jgi:ElaB/YqjD/DUF883 family membrane-anchored ribosome-binding protein